MKTMETKKFSLGAILNMSSGRLTTTMDDIYELANYMTGDNLFTHQLIRAFKPCSESLKAQLPFLDSPEMQFELGRLILMLETPSGKENAKALCTGWLSQMELKFGKEHPVEPLAEWNRKDPIQEAAEMFRAEKVIVAQV